MIDGIIWKFRCCGIIAVNAHAPTEDKADNTKDRFHDDLELVLDKFSKHHMEIFRRLNAKVGKEDIFKPTICNEN
jgi:hypothetical protein